jgi:hypothetical protein
MMFFEMTDDELYKVDLEQFTKLAVGTRVRHKNAGKTAGGIIEDVVGTVVKHHNNGLHSWGGLCVTTEVRWDNGETYDLVYSLLTTAENK